MKMHIEFRHLRTVKAIHDAGGVARAAAGDGGAGATTSAFASASIAAAGAAFAFATTPPWRRWRLMLTWHEVRQTCAA